MKLLTALIFILIIPLYSFGQSFDNPLNVMCGKTVQTQVAVTTDTSAYASGDCVGGMLTIPAVGRAPYYAGRIRKVVLTDKAAAGVNYDLVCFMTASPTAAQCTDQAAFDPLDAELKDVIVIPVTQHTAFSDNGVSSSADVSVPFKLTTTALKCGLVVRGAPTYAAADLTLNLYVEQD